MQTTDYLTLANIIIACIGVMFVILAFCEWRSLKKLRKSVENLRTDIRNENTQAIRAAHRIIAAYGISDVNKRIELLEDTLNLYPYAYNGYNTLGYAYLEKNEKERAIDAFKQATYQFPNDKAGYCDLGFAYFDIGERKLAKKYFLKATQVDQTAHEDIKNDKRLDTELKKELFSS